MALITALKTQQRKANRVSVFLDGKFAFGVNAKVAERFGLKAGMELSPAAVDAVLKGQIQQECFDKAMLYLARRMHSRLELRRKLLRAQFTPETIEHALERLQGLGYVNDEEFARQKLQQSQRKLIGRRRAVQDLMRAGVKSEIAREATQQHFNTDETKDNAQKLIEKKLPSLQRLDKITAKRRLIGLLQRRGFDYDTIQPLVNRALGGQSDTDVREF